MKKYILTKLPLLLSLFFGTSPALTRTLPGSGDLQLARMKKDYHAWIQTREPHDLLCEFDPSPDALDLKDPRFSWIVPLESQSTR